MIHCFIFASSYLTLTFLSYLILNLVVCRAVNMEQPTGNRRPYAQHRRCRHLDGSLKLFYFRVVIPNVDIPILTYSGSGSFLELRPLEKSFYITRNESQPMCDCTVGLGSQPTWGQWPCTMLPSTLMVLECHVMHGTRDNLDFIGDGVIVK